MIVNILLRKNQCTTVRTRLARKRALPRPYWPAGCRCRVGAAESRRAIVPACVPSRRGHAGARRKCAEPAERKEYLK